ncbi:hypothetical protein ECG_05524 [Echinococcus granulosus]|uniref:Expressed protein n=1 Tax=Echinococcus granulosus TaxID=6210 RepID=A0A068WJ06_ECHGR|nr:hypothetical protein ECG_05524 [Echinococcus granulosus]CDS18427.1 expressed protein [Echinococcus granulosus]
MKGIGGGAARIEQTFLDEDVPHCLDCNFPRVLQQNAIDGNCLSLLTFSDFKELGLTKADVRGLESNNILLASLIQEEKKPTDNSCFTHV